MSNQKMENNKKYIWDVIFISAILLISLLVLLAVFLTKKEGAVALVEINGVTVAEYPLSENGVFPLNGGTNVLVIEDGEAYLNFSSCPDHTCENTGKIHYVGETIICLPNKLSITIKGDADSKNSIDLVS